MSTTYGFIELVANISEGQNKQRVAIIGKAGENAGAILLDTHHDHDHNRSVLTFAGYPQDVAATARALLSSCQKHLDISAHQGVHPRFGAFDVCPFIPLEWTDSAQGSNTACTIAQQTAQAAAALDIPAFFYERASKNHYSLPYVRKHAFTEIRPDRGPLHPHPTTGAVAIGVRSLLVAYNIDISTGCLDTARSIAARVRETAGGPMGIRSLALRLPQQKRTQISMNLLQPGRTGIAAAWQAVQNEAAREDVTLIAGELVGLLPRCALRDCSDEILTLSQLHENKTLEHALHRVGLRENSSDLDCCAG